jgi:phosphodiesterase/alkaline phosphatase D-like protein
VKNLKKSRVYKTLFILVFVWTSAVGLMAQAPTATTQAATGVGLDFATLNGTVNANGVSTTVYFEYGTTVAYGSTWPADQSPVTGSTNTAVTATLSELLSNTTYHYRVVATNANGTTNGTDMTFTTLDFPPAVVTTAATGIVGTTATLHGTVNAHGYSTTVEFEYGTDTSYGTTVTADQSPVSSTFTIPVTNTLTGLTDNTLYHYRVKASNVNGTSYGLDMTFIIGTVGTAPTATTHAATAVDTGSATLNGTVNAGNSSTLVTFEYGLTAAYGALVVAAQSPLSGSADTAVSAAISELLPNTTYHYRVVAINVNGTAYGVDMTFTTLPLPPTAVTNGATSVGTTTATLNGTVNANNSSSTVTFQYGLTTAYGTAVTATQSPVTGSVDTAVSRAITGLSNGITYHYRVVAVNAGGTSYGADQIFTTGIIAPTATTNAATAVSTTSATLNGTINANGTGTTVTFQYGNTTNYDRTVSANPGTVTGSSNTAVNAAISTLTPNTTYHYRVVGQNLGGTTYGADMSFTTGSGPAVTTNAASPVGVNSATLNGTVNAKNSSTTVTFEYGLTAAYGYTVTADQSPVAGAVDTAVSKVLNALNPNTTYHYRAVGQNTNGTTYGADLTFTTAAADPLAPTASTQAATGVGPTGATLTGLVESNNQSTTVTFEYGLTTAYGTTVTADQSPVTSLSISAVSKAITGLTTSVTYHYRVVAQNAYGTAYGADMTFFSATPVITAVTEPATQVTSTSATLNATANAAGNFVSTHFEYGLTTGYGSTVSGIPGLLASNTDTSLTASLSGLTPGITYHYRVVLRDAFPPNNPLATGGDMTFTTPVLPTAVTDPASSIGTNSATLNGTVNSNGGSSTVTFEYGETTGYGRTVTAAQSPVTGSTNTPVAGVANDLMPNITYHYRVVAQKGSEFSYGADVTFTTGALPPMADTNAATAVTSTGATLNGAVNANNDITTVTFQYGLTTAYGTTVAADQSPVTGNSTTAVSHTLTGLTTNTTYHFRVAAQNSSGTTYGADMTFFAGTAAPTVTTGSATAIGPTTATLNGTVNANNGSTTVTFEYGETAGYGRTVTAAQSPVSGSTATAVSANLIGLNPNTLHHFRAVGQNSSGTTYGADMTFTTNATNTPTVTTAAVTNIAALSATSGGNVTAEGGAPVTARGVCWSTSPTPTTADNLTSDGTGPGAFTSSLTGLSETTTYYVRAYATNLYGTTYGEEVSFTTNAVNTPTVDTANVTQITADSARSGGNVTNDGGSPVTARGICWSTAPNPTTSNNKTVNGAGTGTFTSFLTNLNPETTYYVRAYATNSAGTAYGGQFQFTTNSAMVSVTITEPGQGETVSGTVTIAASAAVSSAAADIGRTSALSIAKVEFYIDNSKIAEDTTAPYETQWDTTAVSDGSHAIKAVATDQDGNSSQDEITVTVSNTGTGGEIILNRTNLNYGSLIQGSSAADSTKAGPITTKAQTVLIDSSGGGTLKWSISKNAGWLTCSPESGTGAGLVTVSLDTSGLTAGSYSASITVTNLETSNGVVLPVNLTVYKQETTSTPFGYFETPGDNSTVTGSIPVTGWALDDIEVTQLQIYRAAVPGEGSGMVYIGDAVFVDGARPNIETMYPDYPLNYQAGWGYMLLTNMLPNQGNGTFTLYARATDAEGKTVTLGSKTINCDNANAVKPFGAIDTPEQGGPASGDAYVNFGWALTPQPNTIPINGTKIWVWVDGVPLGNPAYNQYRSDIEALFPGYHNSSGAGGYFYLDTTQYSNGVHTISWSAQDNAGNTDGIGSRYFTIFNADSSNTLETKSSVSSESLRSIIKGADKNATLLDSLALSSGTVNLTIKELDYVILWVDENPSAVRGYLDVNDRLNPLPIGSTLDKENGVFFWNPGPGYLGRYPLVFMIDTPNGQPQKKTIVIDIEPK